VFQFAWPRYLSLLLLISESIRCCTPSSFRTLSFVLLSIHLTRSRLLSNHISAAWILFSSSFLIHIVMWTWIIIFISMMFPLACWDQDLGNQNVSYSL
jgi:predicted membrane protein